MTPDEIKHKLDIDDIEIRLSDNGAWYWLHLQRQHNGHTYGHTVKLDLDPSDTQIIDAGDTLRFWWAETIAEPQKYLQG